jgi:hypothetical protein
MAASRGYFLGWVNYDEQYRLRKATSPSSSWGVVDMELWMLCVSTPPSGNIGFGNVDRQSRNSPPPLSNNKNPLTMFVYKEIYNSFIYLSISTKYSRTYFHEVPLLSASIFLILVIVFSNKNHEVFIEIGNYVKNRGYI